MEKENGKRQHCRQSRTHVITEILQSEYTVHEEIPHLKKTESNWRSDEWNEMKEALFKSLSIIQYVNRCSNKNATLLTVRRVYGLKARQKHKNNKTNTSANTLGVPPPPPPPTPKPLRPFETGARKIHTSEYAAHTKHLCCQMINICFCRSWHRSWSSRGSVSCGAHAVLCLMSTSKIRLQPTHFPLWQEVSVSKINRRACTPNGELL